MKSAVIKSTTFRRKAMVMALSSAMTIMTSGCVENVKKTWDDHGGKITGGLAGAVIGAVACNGEAACIVAGAAAGVGLGELWDKRQQELKEIAEKESINIDTKQVETFNEEGQSGLEVAVNNSEMFTLGSPNLTPKAAKEFGLLADVYRDTPQQILVIGHTDASGSDELNLRLSEKRAKTVANLLAVNGIPKDKIYYQGAGESQPVASNDTSEGRASNRRVEIIEVNSLESIAAYSLQRKSDSRFINNSNKTSAEKKEITERMTQSASSETLISQDSEPAVNISEVEVEQQIIAESPEPVELKAEIDFQGQPAKLQSSALVAVGDHKENSFSLMSSANASEHVSPCFMSSPRVIGSLNSLGTEQALDPEQVLKFNDIKQSEYWPGANGSVWLDNVSGNLVALNGLRILRKSGSALGQPETLIYENYAGGNKTISYRMPTHIETYEGSEGLLIRGYFKAAGPLQCVDFVMANRSETDTKAGMLYYETSQGLYEKSVNLHRIKTGS